MTDWQPIESAPKDGGEFLAYCEGEIFVAWFYEPDDEFVWMLPDRISWSDECYINPTHWMPLPPPPKEVKE